MLGKSTIARFTPTHWKGCKNRGLFKPISQRFLIGNINSTVPLITRSSFHTTQKTSNQPISTDQKKVYHEEIEKEKLHIIRNLNKQIHIREREIHLAFQETLFARLRAWLVGARGAQQVCIFNSNILYRSLEEYVDKHYDMFVKRTLRKV